MALDDVLTALYDAALTVTDPTASLYNNTENTLYSSTTDGFTLSSAATANTSYYGNTTTTSTTTTTEQFNFTTDYYDYTNFTDYDDWFANSTDYPSNSTVYNVRTEKIRTAYNVMVAINSAFITFSMGAGVHPKAVLPHIKKPYGPLIGVLCQSIIMPALCFGYSVLFDLSEPIAIGMIITGSCPGGALSNIFTFWSRGNLTLSVAMTVFSTTLSIGFMPLNMFIYTRYWIDEDNESATIPYGNMVFSMLYTWVAVALGVVIAWKAPKAAKYVVRIGSGLGFAFMIAVGVLQGELYGGTGMFNVGSAVWAGAMLMPLIGFFIGFVIASMFCLKLKNKKAIAYETGTQNVAVALSVIALSVEDIDLVNQISPVPMIYAFSQIVVGVGSSAIHQLYYRSREDRCPFNDCGKGDRGGNTDGGQDLEGYDIGNINQAFDPTDLASSTFTVVPVSMNPEPASTLYAGTSTSPPVSSMLDPAADVHKLQLKFDGDADSDS